MFLKNGQGFLDGQRDGPDRVEGQGLWRKRTAAGGVFFEKADEFIVRLKLDLFNHQIQTRTRKCRWCRSLYCDLKIIQLVSPSELQLEKN